MKLLEQTIECNVTKATLKQIENGEILSVKWSPRLEYAWDNGPAIGRYLAELKNGKIIARSCKKCRRIMLPPRMFCELCWRPTDEWVFVQDTGTVNTWTISYIDWKATRLNVSQGERPYTPAVIEIDGASPGMGILHLLNEVEPKKIHRGMRVRAVWKPASERTGAITDIMYFKPI